MYSQLGVSVFSWPDFQEATILITVNLKYDKEEGDGRALINTLEYHKPLEHLCIRHDSISVADKPCEKIAYINHTN